MDVFPEHINKKRVGSI